MESDYQSPNLQRVIKASFLIFWWLNELYESITYTGPPEKITKYIAILTTLLFLIKKEMNPETHQNFVSRYSRRISSELDQRWQAVVIYTVWARICPGIEACTKRFPPQSLSSEHYSTQWPSSSCSRKAFTDRVRSSLCWTCSPVTSWCVRCVFLSFPTAHLHWTMTALDCVRFMGTSSIALSARRF